MAYVVANVKKVFYICGVNLVIGIVVYWHYGKEKSINCKIRSIYRVLSK